MVNSKELRSAYVSVKEDDKENTYNRKVNIAIIGTLPILAGTFIDRVTVLNPTPIDAVNEVHTLQTLSVNDNYNTLVDLTKNDDGVYIKLDRYKFLGKALSTQYSGMYIDFYYDKDFKDIIVIPDLSTLGFGDHATFYENDSRTIRGYSIGDGFSMNNEPTSDLRLPFYINNVTDVPEPNRFTKTRTLTVMAYGLEKNSICNSISRDQSGVTNYSEKGAPLQLVEFELNETLFPDFDKIKFNTYNLIQQSHAELRVDYVGKRNIKKIVVAINF